MEMSYDVSRCSPRLSSLYRDICELGLDHSLNERIGLKVDRGGGFVQYQDLAPSGESPDQRHCWST
jgi:hypothetical protein